MVFTKRIIVLSFIILAAVTAGCARESFPREKVESVRGFSLDSAKFTPFKKRPTAEELYQATLRLYKSFHSVAVTIAYKGQTLISWSEADGKAVDVKMNTIDSRQDYRAISPNKILTTSDDKNAWVKVRNGDNSILYFRDKHSYIVLKEKEDFPNPAALWAGMLPPSAEFARSFSSIKLQLDQKINGTEVYVLELKLPAKRVEGVGFSPGKTTTVFLGKKDLLPRRVVDIQEPDTSSTKLKGLPRDTSTSEFVGFVVNSKLPEALFSTTPPKGAKRIESMADY